MAAERRVHVIIGGQRHDGQFPVSGRQFQGRILGKASGGQSCDKAGPETGGRRKSRAGRWFSRSSLNKSHNAFNCAKLNVIYP